MKNSFRFLEKFLLLAAFIIVQSAGLAEPPNKEIKSEPQSLTAWKVIGPGGGGGIFLPTINPADPNNVFVHCDMTGGYVTYDGGESWRMFSLGNVPVDFEFDPGDPNTIYTATRGFLHSEDRGSGLSLLFRSEDRGKRWRVVYPDLSKAKPAEKLQSKKFLPSELIDGMPDATIQKVKVDPADSRRIYLGMSPLSAYMGGGAAPERVRQTLLFLSTDRCQTWKKVAEIPGRTILAILPGSLAGKTGEVTVFTETTCAMINEKTGQLTSLPLPVAMIAEAEAGTGKDGTVIYILARLERSSSGIKGGVYRSGDWGKTWKQVNEGLFEGMPAVQAPRLRGLALCEKQPDVVYLSAANTGSSREDTTAWLYGIFKSENGGKNWKGVWLATSIGYLTRNYQGGWLDKSYGPGWGGNPINLGVAPSNPDICFGSDAGRAYRTTDGGRTWQQVYSHNLPDGSAVSGGLDVTTCYGVHFDPFDPNHFFITYTDIGLFHTFDGGKSWFHSITGVPEPWVNTCYWLLFDPEVKGRAWSVWANAHDLPRDKMFSPRGFSRNSGGVAVTDDGGRTWKKFNTGMPENSVATNILLDPESPSTSRTLYVTVFDKGVFKSTDGGATWQEANQGLGDNRYAWQIRRNSNGRLFLLLSRGRRESVTVDGMLFTSDNQAASWQPLPLPNGYNAPHDLQIDPIQPERMYLCSWPRSETGEDINGGVLRTEDGGKTWQQVFDQRIRVNSAAINPKKPETIFINTFQNAAYRSDDRGTTWKRLEGYRFKWGQRPNIDPANPDLIYLTTYGGSVFCGPSSGVPGAFEDIENFPAAWW